MGEPDVDAMLASISARQLRKWEVFYSIDPFGDQRADMRMAMIVSKIHNVNCTKRAHMLKPTQCMPYLDRDSSEPDEDKMKRVCQYMAARLSAPAPTPPSVPITPSLEPYEVK